jgi:hypothetical protein
VPSAVIWKSQMSYSGEIVAPRPKIVKTMSEKMVKKLSKSCQKAVKNLSKSCQKVEIQQTVVG